MPRSSKTTLKATVTKEKGRTRKPKRNFEKEDSQTAYIVDSSDNFRATRRSRRIATKMPKAMHTYHPHLYETELVAQMPASQRYGYDAACSVDNEDMPDDRRMSSGYGHGYILGEFASQAPTVELRKSSLSRKRKSSIREGEPSPKKVQFDSEADETRLVQEGEVKPAPRIPGIESIMGHSVSNFPPEDRFLDSCQELPRNLDEMTLNSIIGCPKVLEVGQIASLFELVQRKSEIFSQTWFGCASLYDNERVIREQFPLHDLEHKYPALFWSAVNILDASTTDGLQSGWLNFFTHHEYRPYLIFGILGEWLTQRVFKDTSFGLTEQTKKAMEHGIDKDYAHFDAFIRAKLRAQLVKRYAESNGSLVLALRGDCEKLADEILDVLTPLLADFPSEGSWRQETDPAVAKYREDLRSALIELIIQCAALSHSIIRSGENGMIIWIANKLEKGHRYSPMAPMRCVNTDTFDTRRQPLSENERPTVKMTCWARVEAYVPHGMDLLEMNELQQTLLKHRIDRHSGPSMTDREANSRKIGNSLYQKPFRPSFCWECAGCKEEWDILPKECWKYALEMRQKKTYEMRLADFRNKYARRKSREQKRANNDRRGDPEFSSSDTDNEAPSHYTSSHATSSKSTSESSFHMAARSRKDKHPSQNLVNPNSDSPRGAWVTIYDCLTPHLVYCEWTKPEAAYAAGLQAQGVNLQGKPIRSFNGLSNAVKQARRDMRSSRIKWDDAQLRLWNFYASHNLSIEWLGFIATGVIVLSNTNFFRCAGELTGDTARFIRTMVHDSYEPFEHAICQAISGLNEFLCDWVTDPPSLTCNPLQQKWGDLVSFFLNIIPRPTGISISDETIKDQLKTTLTTTTPAPTTGATPLLVPRGILATLLAHLFNAHEKPNPSTLLTPASASSSAILDASRGTSALKSKFLSEASAIRAQIGSSAGVEAADLVQEILARASEEAERILDRSRFC